MMKQPEPLELAKAFGVPQIDVAVRLGVTRDWTRQLARRPEYRDRVMVAVLETILDRERGQVR